MLSICIRKRSRKRRVTARSPQQLQRSMTCLTPSIVLDAWRGALTLYASLIVAFLSQIALIGVVTFRLSAAEAASITSQARVFERSCGSTAFGIRESRPRPRRRSLSSRFSSLRYSTTSSCRRLIQPPSSSGELAAAGWRETSVQVWLVTDRGTRGSLNHKIGRTSFVFFGHNGNAIAPAHQCSND